MNKGKLFSASDRAIYDALMQSKVIKDALQELFLRRGIIISRDTSREDLAMYFSRIQHDYHDYLRLSELLGSISGKEHLGTKYLKNDFPISDLSTVAESLKNHIDMLDVKTVDTNIVGTSLHLDISYTQVHFSRSEFRQVVEKNAIIEIEKTTQGLVVRHPINKKSDEVLNVFFEEISEYFEEQLNIETISLESVSDMTQRKAFFEHLMNGMPDYKMTDVVDAYVFNPSSKNSNESDEDSDRTETRISKAALKGINVLQSEKIEQFLKDGFCVSRVVWHSQKEDEENSDLYEFEAQFKKPEIMGEFNYIVKGCYKFKLRQEFGEAKHVDSRSSLNRSEETKLNRLIEQAALASMHKVCQVSGSIPNVKDEVVQS